MKSLRQICAATVLSLALAVAVSAGDIDSPGKSSTSSPSVPTVPASVILTCVSLIYR